MAGFGGDGVAAEAVVDSVVVVVDHAVSDRREGLLKGLEVVVPGAFPFEGAIGAFDECLGVEMPVGGARQGDAERSGVAAVAIGDELGAVVVTQLGGDVVGADAGRPGRGPRHVHRFDHIGCSAAASETPAVLAAPHRGEVGLPQHVRSGDVNRVALRLGVLRAVLFMQTPNKRCVIQFQRCENGPQEGPEHSRAC